MTLAATVISISTVLCIFNDWSCTTTTSRHFALDSPFLCLSHDLHFHYIHVSTTLDFYNLFIVEVLHSSCINSNCSHYCSHHLAFEYSQIFLNLLSLLFLLKRFVLYAISFASFFFDLKHLYFNSIWYYNSDLWICLSLQIFFYDGFIFDFAWLTLRPYFCVFLIVSLFWPSPLFLLLWIVQHRHLLQSGFCFFLNVLYLCFNNWLID